MSDNPSKIINFAKHIVNLSTSSPIRKLATGAIVALLLYMIKNRSSPSNKDKENIANNQQSNGDQLKQKKGGKGNVDKEFWERIKILLKIAIPSIFSKEVAYLITLTILLVLRTIMSIWLAEVNGGIVKSIVNRSLKEFISRILGLMLFAIPSSAVNSGMEYFTKLLALSFRERLTTFFHEKYLQRMFYYKICNLDSRIQNPDQRLTQDLDKWATSLSNLYLNFSKPILDLILFSRKLSELVGWEGPALTIGWYLVSGVIIRLISPSFGYLTAKEQKLEGEYRTKQSEIINHSEEIAFYNGSDWERTQINIKFDQLRKHIDNVLFKRFLMGIYDSMLVKYGAVMVGYSVLGLPVFGPGKEKYLAAVGNDAARITRDYIRNSSLLINLAKAIGRIVVSYKEIQSLAGYTTLIYEMKEVLDDLETGKYKRLVVKNNTLAQNHIGEEEKEAEPGSPKKSLLKQQTVLMDKYLDNKGTIITSDEIIFSSVPILTPNGDTLVREMNFSIKPGMHLMITGPNGCGKSSVFRILGELWPIFGGELHKPSIEKIFYIPQRPYLPNGSLRDQLIYPDTEVKQKLQKQISDADLQKILDEVRLGYLVKREGGWDTVNDWNDVLSGGEKQRIALARLIYHKPQYAILDECTSAVSIDVEGHLYTFMKQIGITLITVSHRDTLWKYHDYLLHFKGDKEYTFTEMPIEKKK